MTATILAKNSGLPPWLVLTTREAESMSTKYQPKKPATLAQREALFSEPLVLDFNHTNTEWADAWLPAIRIAVHMAGLNWGEVKAGMQKLVASGGAPEMLEELTLMKHHLAALQAVVTHALDRAFVAIELAGYSPDNLPPDSPMH